MTRTRFVGVVFAVCLTWQPGADRGALAEAPAGNGVVTLGKIPMVTVRPGESTTVVIPIEIAEGYHVQANPASDEFLIPLELELQLEETDKLVSWKPVYPAPGTFRLEGTAEDLLTYHGSIGVAVSIYPSPQVRPGERLFTGLLNYQACDRRRCLFPTSVPVTFKVVISENDTND